jgi:hypothetical protein
MSDLHDKRFPGESDAYRNARERLLEAELALEETLEEVNALRRALPLGGPVASDYGFSEIVGGKERNVAMSDLFGTAQSLFIYSFMFGPGDGAPCPACTSLVDGLNGAADHVGNSPPPEAGRGSACCRARTTPTIATISPKPLTGASFPRLTCSCAGAKRSTTSIRPSSSMSICRAIRAMSTGCGRSGTFST